MLLFIGELQAPAGIVDPIDGFFFMLTHFFTDCVAVSLLLLWLVHRRGFVSFNVVPATASSSRRASKLKPSSSIQSTVSFLMLHGKLPSSNRLRRSNRRSSLFVCSQSDTRILSSSLNSHRSNRRPPFVNSLCECFTRTERPTFVSSFPSIGMQPIPSLSPFGIQPIFRRHRSSILLRQRSYFVRIVLRRCFHRHTADPSDRSVTIDRPFIVLCHPAPWSSFRHCRFFLRGQFLTNVG